MSLVKFLAGSVVADDTLTDRQIRVIANSGKSDRVADKMVAGGCKLANYVRNPVVLADHDRTKAIGTFAPEICGDAVKGVITFAPAGISPKADEYCGLYKAGVMTGVSIGFTPIKELDNKAGGVDYLEWELNELSCVALPCDPSALTIQRSFEPGPDRLYKVGASLNLPLVDGVDFDAKSAAESIFRRAGFGGDNPDPRFAAKGFLVYDARAPLDTSSYAFPFAEVIGGRLTAVKSGLADARAAASASLSRLPGERDKALKAIDAYGGKMAKTIQRDRGVLRVKGLYEVASLAYLLSSLGYQHDNAVREAIAEGDNSKVPGLMADALEATAAAFRAMAEEETDELLAGRGIIVDDGDDDIDVEYASKPAKVKAVIKAWTAAYRKAGRALSAANADHVAAIDKCLKALADCHTKALDAKSDLHDQLTEFEGHLTKALDHAAELKKSTKPKPAVDAEADDSEDDASDDETDDDQELAFEADRRKRLLLLADIEKAV
ncbi:MAG: hypothetical protein P4L82_11950 [Ancalomicrobiaceae bacterium]|nr:hypothetical protein [Ancalomicrobiaceae bacterium]